VVAPRDSVITYAELLTGARLGHHDHTGVRGFFEQLIDEIHGVDRSVAEHRWPAVDVGPHVELLDSAHPEPRASTR
jgi:hypothetical protein